MTEMEKFMEQMEKEYNIMKQIEKLANEVSDLSFMAMFCTLFDTRFGDESVERAEACVQQMRVVNGNMGAFPS